MKKQILRIAEMMLLAVVTVGICFVGLKYLKEAQPQQPTVDEATTLAQAVQEVAAEEKTLVVTSPTESKIAVNEPSIVFTGVCRPDLPLTINDIPIEKAEDGSFSYSLQLNVGENTVVITNGVETFEFKITYKFSIINSVSPKGKVSVDGGTEITLTAEALKNSEVYAMLGKEKITMSVVACGDVFDTYQAVFTAPASAAKSVKLGKITFYASLDGMKDSMAGGTVTIKPVSSANVNVETGRGEVVPPSIDSNGFVNVLSPYVDHQKGNALMCIVNTDYAETVPANTADDKSNPEYTPLIKGTVDYIKSEAVYDNTEYYILLSGTKVEKKNVSSFNGYVMPTNTATVSSNERSTAEITMNWKVPFYSVLRKQSYYTGYSGRKFNVSSFTSKYIDFVFKYTNAADGSVKFSKSSVVSSAEWVNVGDDGTATLRVHLKNSGKFYGYKAYYSSDNRLILRFNEKPQTKGATVVIDPGHGGKDCGAIAVNGTYESKLNLSLALKVKANLESKGYNVKILRTGDTGKTLDERQALARSQGGDIFVSLHHNSSPSSSLSGTEVYYYRAYSKPLASSIHARLANEWRSVYSGNPNMYNKVVAPDGGVRYYPFRVTRIEECPAVLVECGYLSNPTECAYACDDNVNSRMAKAIAQGIEDYFANS